MLPIVPHVRSGGMRATAQRRPPSTANGEMIRRRKADRPECETASQAPGGQALAEREAPLPLRETTHLANGRQGLAPQGPKTSGR